jgi:capsular exopolysaccharide synthesis family protein
MPDVVSFVPSAEGEIAPPFHPVERGDTGELFRTLWRRLLFRGGGASCTAQAIGLTSCLRGEGVSTVAAQLAVAAASAGRPVLLVDVNLESPGLHRLFQLECSPGLADALREDAQLDALIQPSGLVNLSVLTAGKMEASLTRSCATGTLTALVRVLKHDFPLVLFDLPALETGSVAIQCAGLLDGLLLVVEAERVRSEIVQREKEFLTQAGVPLVGAVLNRRRDYVPAWLRAVVGGR